MIKFSDFGNPLLARAPTNGDGSTLAQGLSNRASISAALAAGHTVLQHPASCMSLGSGLGQLPGTNGWEFTGCRPAAAAKARLGMAQVDGFGDYKPQIDILTYDAPAAGGWVRAGAAWKKTFSAVNGGFLGVALFAACRLGDLKTAPIELKRRRLAADCIAEGQWHFAGFPAVVTVCTGSDLIPPDVFYEGLAFNASSGGMALWGYGISNVEIEDLCAVGGACTIGGGHGGVADENVTGRRIRALMSRGNHLAIRSHGLAGSVSNFWFYDSTCDSKARSGSGMPGSTEIGTQNAITVDGMVKDSGAVDCEFLGGYRHTAINLASSKSMCVSGEWPRNISVYSRSRTAPKLIECVPFEYSRAIGVTINGANIANFRVKGQATCSQASYKADIDNIVMVDFTRDQNPSAAASNHGADTAWTFYSYGGTTQLWGYQVRDVTLRNMKIINPGNYPIAANLIVGDGHVPGGLRVIDSLIVDLAPLPRQEVGRSTPIAGPDASVMVHGYTSAGVGAWIDFQRTTFIKANESIWAIKAAGGAYKYSLWLGPNPVTGAPNAPTENRHFLSAAAAGLDAITFDPLPPPPPPAPPPAPAITSALTASGIVGQDFSYQISATNSPTSYFATQLTPNPGVGIAPGLTGSSATGQIYGRPSAAGSYTIRIGANTATATGEAVLALDVAPAPAPAPPPSPAPPLPPMTNAELTAEVKALDARLRVIEQGAGLALSPPQRPQP